MMPKEAPNNKKTQHKNHRGRWRWEIKREETTKEKDKKKKSKVAVGNLSVFSEGFDE